MIKGVIFDIDGVLLDTMPIWNTLGSGYLRSCGIEPPSGIDKTLFSMSMEQGAQYLHDNFLNGKSADDINEEIKKYLEDFYVYRAIAKRGAKELLQFLAGEGIPMAAATSSPRTHVKAALERNALLGYIGKIFTTGELNTSKSEQLIYNKAAEFLGANPRETLVFEDSLYALRTAARAGFVTVGVADSGEPNQAALEAESDVFLKDYKEEYIKLAKLLCADTTTSN